jgi:hypothetical protein
MDEAGGSALGELHYYIFILRFHVRLAWLTTLNLLAL